MGRIIASTSGHGSMCNQGFIYQGGGKSGMLLTLGGQCTKRPHARRVWGHTPPGKFRPSEITSGAFSSKFTLPMICIKFYYTLLTMQPCIEKTNSGNQVSRGGGEILTRGGHSK